MEKVLNLNEFRNLDRGTQERLEKIQQRKAEIDAELTYAEYYLSEKAKFTWDEIITFAWEKGNKGAALSRTKELFLNVLLDEKLKDIPFEEISKALMK